MCASTGSGVSPPLSPAACWAVGELLTKGTLRPPSAGCSPEAVLASRNILRHSTVQPIITIIVSLLTSVRKLSVKLFLSSCFSGAGAKC